MPSAEEGMCFTAVWVLSSIEMIGLSDTLCVTEADLGEKCVQQSGDDTVATHVTMCFRKFCDKNKTFLDV